MTMKRNGFTLVELLIVVVLGGLVLAAIFQILVSNQQIYTRQSQSVLAQQTVRGGIEFLSQEIRELSPGGDDFVDTQADQMTVRVMRKTGVTCLAGGVSGDLQLRAGVMSTGFAADDSILVFFNPDGDPANDDFAVGMVTQVENLGVGNRCGEENSQRIYTNAPADPATVGEGALIRSFESVTYTTTTDAGETFLARTRPGVGEPELLVGPIAADDGLLFEYLDANGEVISPIPGNATERRGIRSIRLTIRTTSQARDAQGQPIEESLSVIVNPRN
jgi:prepilin-type N-terminal cleavage/methylation domain-containing protein